VFKKLTTLILLVLTISTQPVKSVSLLNDGGVRNNSLTQGPRGYIEPYIARNIGDVVTIKVVENVEALKEAQVRLNNDTRSNSDLTFRQGKTNTSTLTPDVNEVANMITSLSLPVDYSRRNLKQISIDNREEFFTLVSCLVVETDPESGNMIVEGSRQILMEGQNKSLYIRGIVFPKDIDSNNELPSYKLANAQIQIIGTGSLSKERDNGIVNKILRRIF
jgi:flagellar L-ring protein FlgH